MQNIKTGDIVIHIPTGEHWTVACINGDSLSWYGWQEGTAKLSDCKLIKSCSEEVELETLKRLKKLSGKDHRKEYAIKRLKELTGEQK